MEITSLDTPALLIDREKMIRNLIRMAELCSSLGIKLRPHIKTHKIGEIALSQVELGGNGIAVAKLGEAEEMHRIGINDIVIANQIIGRQKIERLNELLRGCEVKICVDSSDGVDQLEKYIDQGKRVEVFIEIDTGMERCGLREDSDVIELAQYINKCEKVSFTGLLSHSGNIYRSKTLEQVRQIALEEIDMISVMANRLRDSGVKVKEVSIGSTPATVCLSRAEGITEFRPGNYVFNDYIQVSLGVARVADCALLVVATVISRPAPERVVIDAGSKCLGLDKGVHGSQVIKGHGLIKEYPTAVIERLSEEHGIIRVENDNPLKIGDRVTIIPNHACSVVNLFDQAYVTEQNRVIDCWKITARGKVT